MSIHWSLWHDSIEAKSLYYKRKVHGSLKPFISVEKLKLKFELVTCKKVTLFVIYLYAGKARLRVS
jgi:hypothetical protein